LHGSDHHGAFDAWWEHARENYMSWQGDKPVGFDLYYDPVIDEHHGHGPGGLALPAWYLAPQRRAVARAGWELSAALSGALADGTIIGLDDPMNAVALLQLAGEFADDGVRERIWNAAEEFLEPAWDRESGEFTLGFGLDEPHPRGQLNARAMAARACTAGAWARIFNEPNLRKFEEPTIVGVDFPSVALREARWDSDRGELFVSAVAANEARSGEVTRFRVTNVVSSSGWTLVSEGTEATSLSSAEGDVLVGIPADGRTWTIVRG
jgi:hypothetical protein